MKYDHYCPWADQAIGHNNYKYYILLLFYGVLSIIGVILACVADITYHFTYSQNQSFIFLLISIFILIISLYVEYELLKLWYFHILLITVNMSTKEFHSWKLSKKTAIPTSIYDMGRLENWKQALGKEVIWWWSPWCNHLTTDGYSFPSKPRVFKI
uniref:Palmitoyltransferase n=1 Tax=Arcella intermedia TaxID=1963864 RepID=A0A6B2LL88_9EUKA